MRIAEAVVNEPECLRLIDNAGRMIGRGNAVLHGVVEGDIADAMSGFLLGFGLGVQLIAGRAEVLGQRAEEERLEAELGPAVMAKARRMAHGYAASMARAEREIKAETVQLSFDFEEEALPY